MLTAGESICYYRKRLHLTQAQLAQRLGVSVQTVSGWETGGEMPDVSLIVPLAETLGTTTDEILQFGERRKHWEQCWMETLQYHGDDEYALLQVALEALKEFPWDWQFLYRAAVDELRIAEQETDPRTQTELYGRAAAHARLSLETDPERSAAQWVLEKAQTKTRG